QARCPQEAEIEVHIVPDERRAPDERPQVRNHVADAWRTGDDFIRDACELGDEVRNRGPGVDEGLVLAEYLVSLEFDGANFDNAVVAGVETGGLKVDGDESVAHGTCLSSRGSGERPNRSGSVGGGQI